MTWMIREIESVNVKFYYLYTLTNEWPYIAVYRVKKKSLLRFLLAFNGLDLFIFKDINVQANKLYLFKIRLNISIRGAIFILLEYFKRNEQHIIVLR